MKILGTPIFIGLAGPSGSGKTTLVRHIGERYPHITHIRLDGFFKSFETFPKLGMWVNRETPENINWDDFFTALQSLRAGKSTSFPVYDKKTGVQTGTELVVPSSIIFVEGYLLYHDQRIKNLFDSRLYLDVSVKNQYIRKKTRWPEMDDAYFYDVVIPMFEKYGKNGADCAHHILNGNDSEREVCEKLDKLISAYSCPYSA